MRGYRLKNRESPARVELPPTWREQPVRSVVIASYKKNTDGRYHRHNRMVGTRRSGREGIVSMTRLGPNTGGCSSPDCRGQPGTCADPNPVALADWSLEFL